MRLLLIGLLLLVGCAKKNEALEACWGEMEIRNKELSHLGRASDMREVSRRIFPGEGIGINGTLTETFPDGGVIGASFTCLYDPETKTVKDLTLK